MGEDGGSRIPARLENKLSSWVSAGLIDEDTARAIAKHEATRAANNVTSHPVFGVALLGALALVSGLGSVIAYNWQDIPNAAKLVGMAVLMLGAATATWRVSPKAGVTQGHFLDVALVTYSGFTLGGLTLVSQIYEQDGKMWQLLLFWLVLISPALLALRSTFANTYWYAGAWVTLVTAAEAVEDVIDALPGFGTEAEVGVVQLTWLLGTLGAAGLVWLGQRTGGEAGKPRRRLGSALLHLHLWTLGAVGSFAWQADTHSSNVGHLALGVIGVGVLWPVLILIQDSLGWKSIIHLQALFAGGLLTATLGLSSGADSALLSFVSFVAFWGALWYVAHASGDTQRVRMAVGMLGLRIVAASFELFESLLITGLVLLALGGSALAWTVRSARHLKKPQASSETAS